MSHTITGPLPNLPRLLMRRSLALASGVLLLAAVLGLAWVEKDIADEVDAAMTLAQRLSALETAAATPDLDDARARAVLVAAAQGGALRHVTLSVHDEQGRTLLPEPPRSAGNRLIEALVALHRAAFDTPDPRHAEWALPRPGGQHWTVRLAASHDGERREAIASLLGLFGLLMTSTVALLLVMRWNLRRAFAPLDSLLAAIGNISRSERGVVDARAGTVYPPDTAAARTLPTMPVQELETLAEALRHLGAALDATEAHRRLLASRLQTLQDDERAHLARELHDEFGQRLTALRADAAWLQRCTADQPALQAVVASIAAHGQAVAQDIRSLLARLQPFGAGGGPGAADAVPLAALLALLKSLVDSWAPRLKAAGTALRLDHAWVDEQGRRKPQPDAAAEGLALPRALALALYRISQEALTNAARHASAQHVVLALEIRNAAESNDVTTITWSVVDDGVGLGDAPDAMQRGNGLVGSRDRVWALGADFEISRGDADPGDSGTRHKHVSHPGLRLSAAFPLRSVAATSMPDAATAQAAATLTDVWQIAE